VKLPTADEPGRVASGALAVVVHLMFVGLLVFGISWQKKIATPVVVDLWQDLPEPVKKVTLPPEPPKAQPKPVLPPPKPVPEVRKEPVPPPPPAPKVETLKPSAADIELKEKLRKQKEEEAERREEQKKAELEKRKLEEEEHKAAEEQRREEAEQKRVEAEQKRAEQEKLRREDEARKAEEQKHLEEQRHAEELKREEARREQAVAAERERQQQEVVRKQREVEEGKRRAEAAARAAQQKEISKYMAQIQDKVIRKIVMPPDLKGRPEGIYDVTLLPGGEILEIELKRSSGVPAYDAAVGRAISLSSPLPVPDDSDLFQQYFRKFNFTFKP